MKIKRLLMVILGTFICSLSFNVFLSPYHIIPGGVGGIAILLKNLFDFNESLTIAVLSILLLVISFLVLGKSSTIKSIIGSILFPLFVFLTGLIIQYLDLHIDNRLLVSIIGGAGYGFGIGLVYKEGYTTGGVDILAKILNQYFHISLGIATLILDSIVILSGMFIFGFEAFIYSIITVFVYSMMIDKVILGLFGNKSFYIITNNPDTIKDYIIKELGHGATVLNGKGAYSNEKKYIVFTSIPTRDYYKLKDYLSKLDDKSFFVVCDSYEVGGGK